MTINIRVIGRQAIAQLNQVQSAVNGVGGNAAGAATRKQLLGFFDILNSNKLIRAGKNLQWVGRQLTFAFTLPLAAAAVSLFKVNQNIDRSMREVIKVYGDGTKAAGEYERELDALKLTFAKLSTRFGEHQEDVIDIAAAWASAGSAGSGLARNVNATLEAMILGSIDAEKATEGLIAIQATWGLSTQKNKDGTNDLTNALGILNVIENQTGIRMEGLIDVLARSGGAARVAGADIRHVAAMAAAISPAAGTAAQAGNALKSVISALVNPSQNVVDVLGKMGIEVMSKDWLGKSVVDKIETIAGKFKGLSSSNQGLVSSVIAGRYQFNRFSVLMNDIASNTGFYAKALAASGDEIDPLTGKTKFAVQYTKELNDVLRSNPRKWDIMTQSIRNTMAKAFIPMMPLIMQAIQLFERLATWFGSLSDSTRGWILMGLALLVVLGPAMQLVAAFAQLIGLFQVFGKFAAQLGTRIIAPLFAKLAVALGLTTTATAASGAAVVATTAATASGASAAAAAGGAGIFAGFTLPVWALPVAIGLALAAVLVVIFIFRDEVWEAIQWIAKGFSKLPGVIVDVFNNIIDVIGKAVDWIVDALSYLNPFAKHSPSLVDNVRAGVAVILEEYAQFNKIPGLIRSASEALDDFNAISAPGRRNLKSAEMSDIQGEVSKADPAAGQAAGAMIGQIGTLEDSLPGLTREIAAQKQIVDTWEAALKAANQQLDAANDRLDAAKDALQDMGDQIDSAKDLLNTFANAPLKGMKEYEDQLFDNEQAQNKLRLQLLQFEKAGISIEKIKEKYSALNGEIEMLRGRQKDLRLAGAGSDVLKVFDESIAAVQAQQGELSGVEKQITDIQDALDALDLEHRFLELTKNITFDPLLRQIEEMLDTTKEMTFEEIIAGIKQQQDLLAILQPQYDEIAETVKREEAAVRDATAARDAVADTLDIEQEKLDLLNEGYSATVDLINDMREAMEGYAAAVAAAEAAKEAAVDTSLVQDLFDAGLDADFEDQGNPQIVGAEGDVFDIEAFNKELDDSIAKAFEDMNFSFDPFQQVKDLWNGFVDWVKDNWKLGLAAAVALAIAFAFPPALIVAALIALGMVIWNYKDQIWKWVMDWIVTPVLEAMASLADFLIGVWDTIYAGIEGFIELVGAVFEGGWDIITGVVEAVWDFIAGIIETSWNFVVGVVEAGWDLITDAFDIGAGIIEAVWNFVVGVIKGGWDLITGAFNIGVGIIETVWNFVVGVIKGGWDLITGAFRLGVTIIETVIGFFGDLFMGLWNNFLSPVFGWINEEIIGRLIPVFQLFAGIIEIIVVLIVRGFQGMWDLLQIIFDAIVTFVSGVFTATWNALGTAVEAVWKAIEWAVSWYWGMIQIIFDVIVAFVSGAFTLAWKALGTVVETVWDAIWIAISWTWGLIRGTFDTIVTFVSGVFTTTWNALGTAIDAVWSAIQWAISWYWGLARIVLDTIVTFVSGVFTTTWNAITTVVEGVWTGISTAVQTAWDLISPILDSIVTFVEGTFSTIWGTLQDVITAAWSGILFVIGWVWDKIATVLEGGVNFLISAFNLIAGAVNGIADFLSIDVHVNEIDKITIPRIDYSMPEDFGAAQGGAIGKDGGRVMGARALVGEGSNVWPEYVIPTDPRYRGRASNLYNQLGQRLGAFAAGGVVDDTNDSSIGIKDPKYMIAGTVDPWWSGIMDTISGVWQAIKDGALSLIWDPVKSLANTAIDQIPLKFVKDIGKGIVKTIDNWVRGGEEAVDETHTNIPEFFKNKGSWKAVTKLLEAKNIPFKILSTYRPGAKTRNSGNVSMHALDRAVDLSGPSGMSTSSVAGAEMMKIAANIRNYAKPHLHELIWGARKDLWDDWDYANVFDGADHQYRAIFEAEHMNHVHASLASGGRLYVPRRAGGVNLNVAEGRGGEQVQVLPTNGRGGGETHLNFYGDLVFPNVTDQGDAEGFIKNLEALSTKRSGN